MPANLRHNPLILSGLLLSLGLAGGTAGAQPTELELDTDTQALLGPERSESYREQPRELTVLSQTLASEELDRAVLNRLLQEIELDAESVRLRFDVDADTLEGMAITISNARHFINDNEMANIRAMCGTWRNSSLSGDERLAEALQAYRARQQLTLNFIARYYRMVVYDIEAILDGPAQRRFRSYLDDRRRRLANAGNVVPGVTAQNIQSGREAVQFHCQGPADRE